ncbi:MAG TPA: outer membrane lipoprotein-sorting protein [Bacteroidetes bacterium]|nr:outer membrane lipoprotein-sorting protein [Bacteroidota bacterium]
MKTKIIISIIGLLYLTSVSTDAAGQENANTLLSKTDHTMFGVKDKSADVKMIMINLKNGKQKVKEATLLQKGTNKKLFRYTYPKSDSGIATLSLPDNQVYLYLPLFKKPKKITNLAQSNAFNHSDFSFQDMATKSYAEKYTPQLIGTTDTSYVLKLKPKDDNSTYSYLVATINKSHYYPEKIAYYNQKGQKVKVAVYHFKKVENYWIADVVSMTDLKKNHETKIIMSNIKINRGLNDDMFTVKNLAAKQ